MPDTATTIILQLQLGEVSPGEQELLKTRFHRFYDAPTGRIEYPCSNDSHAADVFSDEFEKHPDAARRPVDYAAVLELPYDSDHFVPFTEDNAGELVAELGTV